MAALRWNLTLPAGVLSVDPDSGSRANLLVQDGPRIEGASRMRLNEVSPTSGSLQLPQSKSSTVAFPHRRAEPWILCVLDNFKGRHLISSRNLQVPAQGSDEHGSNRGKTSITPCFAASILRYLAFRPKRHPHELRLTTLRWWWHQRHLRAGHTRGDNASRAASSKPFIYTTSSRLF